MSEFIPDTNLKTPAELMDEVEHRLEKEGDEGFVGDSSAAVIRADRRRH